MSPPTPENAGAALRLDLGPDGVARLTLDQPGSRANTLHQGVLAEFERALDRLADEPGLRGVLLASGKPGMFIAGADLRELAGARPGSDEARALVRRGLALVARFEALPCPTAVLIDGACMGGGLELSLGFDYRLAGTHPKTEIGLPETKIGLIPGWGGTQRLARLIGPNLAAELICPGDSVRPARAREIGLVFDAVPSDALEAEGRRLLAWSWETGDWQAIRARKPLPVGLSEEQREFAYEVAKAQVLAKSKGHFPAPLAALDAIFTGGNRPLADGLEIETERFVPLVGSPISRNLIALFFLNQRLQKDPGAETKEPPREVRRVGVVGAGIMGAGIAAAHLRRGLPVVLTDASAVALEKGAAGIAKGFQTRAESGRMAPADVVSALGLLERAGDVRRLAEADVVIEAVVEDEALKTALYRGLQEVLRPDAILATNTSTISVTRMAGAVRRPENFAGLHFFNPVDRMPLVEVIRGEKTSDATVVTLVALAKRLGKSPTVVRDGPGFLVNRILFPYLNEAMLLLEEGADPRAVDRAATDFGMPMGPVTLSDVVGLDTCLHAGRVVNRAFADRAKDNRILGELVNAGRLGQKSGAGFYSYAKSPRGNDDPALAPLLVRCRTDRRAIGAEELTDRLFLPMLVEATRVLADGIVRDPADIDLGLILGTGFPTFRGGLLRWADAEGHDKILARLAKYERLGPRFAPTEILRRKAADRTTFFPA